MPTATPLRFAMELSTFRFPKSLASDASNFILLEENRSAEDDMATLRFFNLYGAPSRGDGADMVASVYCPVGERFVRNGKRPAIHRDRLKAADVSFRGKYHRITE